MRLMQFAGIDFPSLFERDNFTLRRTTGHNMLDPESLISGAELKRGMDYKNSTRAWCNEQHYLDAVTGEINTTEVLESAPRVFRTSLFFRGALRVQAMPAYPLKDAFRLNRYRLEVTKLDDAGDELHADDAPVIGEGD